MFLCVVDGEDEGTVRTCEEASLQTNWENAFLNWNDLVLK